MESVFSFIKYTFDMDDIVKYKYLHNQVLN